MTDLSNLPPLIITLVLLILLDVLLWRVRLSVQEKKLPLLDSISGAFHRFSNWLENWQTDLAKPRKRIDLPAAFAALKRAKPAPETEPVTSPALTEPVPDALTSVDSEIQAAGGMAHVHITADVPPGSVIHITISTDSQGHASVYKTETAARRAQRRIPAISLPNLRPALQSLFTLPPAKLTGILFALALIIYLSTHLIGLTDFPIYFFGDEAVQTVSADNLIQRGLRGPDGTFLPTYFQNGVYFNLSASVYAQVLPTLLFGKSIFVTRATSVLITLFAAVCVGLILRKFLDGKRWWLATILLSVIPAWFLHSRTAFETAIFVSFYAAFLYFYLEYRLSDPNKVYWAVLFAGLAFYSYSPGQSIIAVTGLLLFFSDIKYHWQQRGTLLTATGLLALIALPYVRFRLTSDYSPLDHLRSLGSYWIQPIPMTQKLFLFLGQYIKGLSPLYWFFETPDMARHQMHAYGNIPLWFAPFMLVGTAVAFYRWRSPAHRLLLIAALAAPTGAALAEIGITRILVFVIPASLLAALGLDSLLTWLESWLSKKENKFLASPAFGNTLALITFVLIATFNISMLADALIKGPTWYSDYGLYGMQYGAKQVYEETVVPMLEENPDARFVVTPSWANGAEQMVWFFVPQELQSRVMLGQIYDLMPQKPDLTENNFFIVTPEEYDKLIIDPKLKEVVVRNLIPFPNGQTGFYVLNMQISEDAEAILAAEIEKSRTPIEESITWNGQTVRVVHSPLGGGTLLDLTDNDKETLAKGEDANPIVFEFFLEKPISTKELELTTGSMGNFDVVVQLYAPGEDTPISYKKNYMGLQDDPTINLPLTDGPAEVDHIFITIRDNTKRDSAQVHVREITFK